MEKTIEQLQDELTRWEEIAVIAYLSGDEDWEDAQDKVYALDDKIMEMMD